MDPRSLPEQPPADLEAVEAFVQTAWTAYEAAEDVRSFAEHDCDARCRAVNHIPDLTSYRGEVIAELRVAGADNERLRTFKVGADRCSQRLEGLLCGRIAEQLTDGPYPDGDVQGTVRQAGLLAGLEKGADLIAKHAAELRAARRAHARAGGLPGHLRRAPPRPRAARAHPHRLGSGRAGRWCLMRDRTATDRLASLLAHSASGDPGVRCLLAALRHGPDRLADQLGHDATLVDALGPAEATRVIVAGHRGGLTG